MVSSHAGLRPRIDPGLTCIGVSAAARFLDTSSIPQTSQTSRAGPGGRVEVCGYFYRINDLAEFSIDCPDAVRGRLSDGNGSTELAALAVLQLHLPSSRQDGAICVLAGFRVAHWAARKGVGTSLYLAMLAHAFQRCQTPKNEVDVPVPAAHPQHCPRLVGRTEPAMTLELGEGPCRRKDDMLAFLKSLGWCNDIFAIPLRLDQAYLDPLAMQSSVSFVAPDPRKLLSLSKRQRDNASVRQHLARLVYNYPKALYPRGAVTGTKGLFEFVLPAVYCADAVTFLENPDSWGTGGVGRHLMISLGHSTTTPTTERVYAMEAHKNVNALVPNSSLQQKCNAISNCPAQAARMLASIPGLAPLARGALQALGVRGPQLEASALAPDCVHAFRLTPDNQMSYGWHADDTDLVDLVTTKSKENNTISKRESLCEGIRSVVVQLSSTGETGMVMWSCENALYKGQGAAKAFHGSCLHASLPWAPNSTTRSVWKVSFFWLTSSLGLDPDKLPC